MTSVLTKFTMYSLGSEDVHRKKQRQPSSSLRFLCRVVADNVVRKNADVYSSSAAASLGNIFGWDLALEITTQAGGAYYGGEPFQTLPILAVCNLQGELQTAYEGRVAVQLLANNANHAMVPCGRKGG